VGVVVHGVREYKKNVSTFERESQRTIERTLRRASLRTRSGILRHMSQRRRWDAFLGALPGAGDNLIRRSGASASRLSPGGLVTVARVGRDIITQSAVGSPDPHIKFLEEGGDKAPPQGNSIPLAQHQTFAGVDRFPFGSRNIPGAFIYPTERMLHPKSGSPKRPYPKDKYLVRAVSGKLLFLRLFKDKIHVRGRHLYRNAVIEGRKELPPEMKSSMRVLVREANR